MIKISFIIGGALVVLIGAGIMLTPVKHYDYSNVKPVDAIAQECAEYQTESARNDCQIDKLNKVMVDSKMIYKP